MQLTSYTDRINKGIDSFERALAYAGILLYQGLKDPNNPVPPNENPFSNNVKIILPDVTTLTGKITIEAIFPIDRIAATELGLNFIDSVDNFGFTSPELEIDCESSSSLFQELKEEPSYVDNLERYFVWLCDTVKSQLLSFQPDKSNVIKKQTFLDNPQYPQVKYTVQLEYDSFGFLRDNNLLCNLLPLLQNEVVFESSGQTQNVGNSGSFGNNNSVGNGSNEIVVNLGNNNNVGNNSTLGN